MVLQIYVRKWLIGLLFCFRGQAEKEFKVEVEAIGRVRHKNLVRLLGYCAEGAHRYFSFHQLYPTSFSFQSKFMTLLDREFWFVSSRCTDVLSWFVLGC